MLFVKKLSCLSLLLSISFNWTQGAAEQTATRPTTLYQAAAQGNLEQVQRLINTPSNPQQCSPLHIAALNGHVAVVEYLLDHHADINATTNGGLTPLHYAAIGNKEQVIRTLCRRGAPVNCRATRTLDTPLYISVQAGNVESVKTLLEFNANVELANHEGTSPLLRAIWNNRQIIACLLLDHGASVLQGNLLIHAVFKRQREVIRKLCERNAPDIAEARDLAYNLLRDEIAKEQTAALKKETDLAQEAGLSPVRSLRTIISTLDYGFPLPPSRLPTDLEAEAARILGSLLGNPQYTEKPEPKSTPTQPAQQPLPSAPKTDTQPTPTSATNSVPNPEQKKSTKPTAPCSGSKKEEKSAPKQSQAFQEQIDQAIRTHETASPYDNGLNAQPIGIRAIAPIVNINGNVVPSLQQKRTPTNTTLDCGYFALYNAMSFVQPQQYDRLNRPGFVAFFRQALEAMSRYPDVRQFDDLEERELRHIIRTLNLPIAVLTMQNLLAVAQQHQTLQDVFEENAVENKVSTQQLLRFFAGEINNLVIVASIEQNSHWIAINAERNAGRITFTVADSLHSYADMRNPKKIPAIRHVLLEPLIPYHVALSNPINEWEHVITPQLCFLQTKEKEEQKEDGSDTDSDSNQEKDCESPLSGLAKQKEKDDTPTTHKKAKKESSSKYPSYIVAPRRELSPALMIKVIESAPRDVHGIAAMLNQVNTRKNGSVHSIFHGVPGTSKSTIPVALAQFSHRHYILISAALLQTTYMSSGATHLAEIIEPILRQDPNIIIVIDEIDRLQIQDSAHDSATMALAAFIDRCNDNYPNVAFIATTNHLDMIERPLLERFSEDIIEIPLPNYDVRLQVIKDGCRELRADHCVGDVLNNDGYHQRLAVRTEGFSIRHIQKIFNKAKSLAGIAITDQMLVDMKANLAKEEADSFVTKRKSLWVKIFGEQKIKNPRDENGNLVITQAHVNAAYTVINAIVERLPSLSSRAATFAWESAKSTTKFVAGTALNVGIQVATQNYIQKMAEARAEQRRETKQVAAVAPPKTRLQKIKEGAWTVGKYVGVTALTAFAAKGAKYVAQECKPEIQKAARYCCNKVMEYGPYILEKTGKMIFKH